VSLKSSNFLILLSFNRNSYILSEMMNYLSRWQTLNPRSVLSHVRMPEAFSIHLGFFEFSECKYLRECLIGRPPQSGIPSVGNDLTGIEDVHSEVRLVDSVYTRLLISWRGITFDVQSAQDGEDLLLLVEPLSLPTPPVLLTVEAGVLWDRLGGAESCGDKLIIRSPNAEISVYATEARVRGGHFPAIGAHMALRLDRPIGICTGSRRTMDEIRAGIYRGLNARDTALGKFDSDRELRRSSLCKGLL
jgi:hypothetical protein